MILEISLILILLFCSALVSGAEVALFSLKKSDLKNFTNKSSRSEKIIKDLLKRPKKLLATILVANNFINIAIILLFSSLNNRLFNSLELKFNFFFIKIDLVFFYRSNSNQFFNSTFW